MTDLSIEVCHLYVHRMTEAKIHAAAVQAASWVKPLVAANPQQTYTVSVFLDDYTRPRRSESKWTMGEAHEAVVRIFDAVGFPVDYIVMEAACAQTVGHLKALLAGAGDAESIEKGWLSNGEPARHQIEVTRRRSPRHAHPISLDVQLWSDDDEGVRWACPMVAAWWQLLRLGGLKFFRLPLPINTWSRPGAHGLEATRTLTVLDVQYLEVEHAVQNILRHVSTGVFGANLTDRISYIFVPEVQ